MNDRTESSDQLKDSGSESEITAAGPAALAEVLHQLVAKPGLIRGAKGLAKMNQSNGFDCPGCAWPEDPEHQKHAWRRFLSLISKPSHSSSKTWRLDKPLL